MDAREPRGRRHPRGLASRQEKGARFLTRHPQDAARRPYRAQRRAQGAGASRAEIRRRGHRRDPEHRPAARAGGLTESDPHAWPRRRDPLHALRHGVRLRCRPHAPVGLRQLQDGRRTQAKHRVVRRNAHAYGRDQRRSGTLRPVRGDRDIRRGLSRGRLRAAGAAPPARPHRRAQPGGDRQPAALPGTYLWGRDEDWIDYHPAYREMEKIAFEDFGMHAMTHRAGVLGMTAPAHPLVKYGITYLFVQAEFGLMCPVSVSDTSNFIIKRYGSEALKRLLLDRLLSQDPAVMLQGTQFITDKAGGSDVCALQTEAERVGVGARGCRRWQLC